MLEYGDFKYIFISYFFKDMTNLNISSDIAVLKNLPSNHESSGLDNLRWFTNSALDNTDNDDIKAWSTGTIIGIIISVVISVSIILYFLWKRSEWFRRIVWKRR
jgi:hypothetical protein